jgi:hypothetical protein
MTNLKLDEQQAWFLDRLLETALKDGYGDLFLTEDEEGKQSFDWNFHSEIGQVWVELHKARGLP